MATDLALEKIQRWMQACIQEQGPCEEVIERDRVNAEIPAATARTVVLPSKTLSALDRLDIYRDMYLLRMEEALSTDFPALKHFLGEDGFMQLVTRYTDAHPSRSYTFNRFGDYLVDFVAKQDDLPKKEFCHDLARLEFALTNVFDAPETAPLTEEQVRAVPQDAWENARLKPVAAFALASFDYPVSLYLGGVDEENPFPRLARKKTYVVCYRKDYHVYRLNLEEPAYELLSALAAGETVGEAIMAVMTKKRRHAVKQAKLFEWFSNWMAERLFQAVELPVTS
jgi:hypothetical protein